MNYRKEGGSRETQALPPGLLTMIVKIRLKHVSSPRSLALTFPLYVHPESTYLICTDLVGCSTIYSKMCTRP